MIESLTMLSPSAVRKALVRERRISIPAVAAEVPCSVALVRRVVAGGNSYETPKSRRIKVLIAGRLGTAVAAIWPEDEHPAGLCKNDATPNDGGDR